MMKMLQEPQLRLFFLLVKYQGINQYLLLAKDGGQREFSQDLQKKEKKKRKKRGKENGKEVEKKRVDRKERVIKYVGKEEKGGECGQLPFT